MTVYNKQNIVNQEEVYDIAAEKKRIAEGTAEIKKNFLKNGKKNMLMRLFFLIH